MVHIALRKWKSYQRTRKGHESSSTRKRAAGAAVAIVSGGTMPAGVYSEMTSDGGSGLMSAESGRITLHVHTTTGGRMQLQLHRHCSIVSLKRTLSARLRLAKDRIVLLHRNRQLKEGTLETNSIRDGERLTLLPSVETGLQAVKPEQSVLQALESLSDTQVENFLCGRAPLHLTMRLGDHMIFVKLQLCAPPETPPATPTTPTCPAEPPETSGTSREQQNGNGSSGDPGSGGDTGSGAVIERMCHLGRGVYSGTFSGTLSPELQDGEGRPRRHVSTILHILRDLLGASHPWRNSAFAPTPGSAPTPLATPPPTPPPSGSSPREPGPAASAPVVHTEEEHRLLRGKLDQIHATLRERRRARRSAPYGKTGGDGTVFV